MFARPVCTHFLATWGNGFVYDGLRQSVRDLGGVKLKDALPPICRAARHLVAVTGHFATSDLRECLKVDITPVAGRGQFRMDPVQRAWGFKIVEFGGVLKRVADSEEELFDDMSGFW